MPPQHASLTSRATSALLLLAAALAGTSLFLFPFPVAIWSIVLGCAMLAIAREDARRFIVPDIVSLPMIPAGLVATALLSPAATADSTVLAHVFAILVAIAALLAIRHAYQKLRGIEGLGLGDIKLATVAGAWVGPEGLGHTLLIACVSAIVYIFALFWMGRVSVHGRTPIPFGVFLAPAIWIVWAHGRIN